MSIVRLLRAACLAGFALAGCSNVVGVDKDYVPFERGDAGALACLSSAGCPEGQKCCGAPPGSALDPSDKVCTGQQPMFGCSKTECVPCPVPEHAVASCIGESCSFTCVQGYKKNPAGTGCVSDGSSGGSGGSGGGGQAGASGECTPGDAQGCPACAVRGFPCCNNDSRCGCSWFALSYCY